VTHRLLLASAAAVLTGASILAAAVSGQADAAPAAHNDRAQAGQAARTAQVAPGNGPAAVLAGMSEGQIVGQLFMAGNPATGPVSSDISTDISTYHTGSVILTGDSSAGVTATLQLTNQLQALATSSATDSVPLFIATNQEGGNVQSLTGPGFSTMPTALSQGSEPPAQLLQNAYAWGSQLAAAGVNLNLAPVLDTVPEDLASTNQPIGIYQREYGYTPAAVTTAGMAFIQGMHEAGVGTVIKHFPGLGRASGNTDTTYGVTDDVTTYDDPYLQPYATAISSYGIQGVMVSEAIYTLIDPTEQAVFSPTVIGGMLRTELGYTGMIMSDSMEAAAVSNLTPAEQAVDFINAGGDLVLATDPSVIPAMYNAVLSEAQTDPAFATLVSQAALTVLTAKQARTVTDGPAAIQLTNNTISLYYTASDGTIWGTNQTAPGGAFAPAAQVSPSGATFSGLPAVVQNPSNGLVSLFALNSAGSVEEATQSSSGGPLTNWAVIGTGNPTLAYPPDVLQLPGGLYVVYAVASDGTIWGTDQTQLGGAFVPWAQLSPSGLGLQDKVESLYVRGLVSLYALSSSGSIEGSTQSGTGGPFTNWGGIGSANPTLAWPPDVMLLSSGVIAAYGADSTGNIWGTSQSTAGGPFSPWQLLASGVDFQGKVASLEANNLISLYALTSYGSVLGTSQSSVGGAFPDWITIGSGFSNLDSPPAVLLLSNGLVAVYAEDSNGNIWGTSQNTAGGPFSPWLMIT
jgi:beta-N-acetylhexosaminidase